MAVAQLPTNGEVGGLDKLISLTNLIETIFLKFNFLNVLFISLIIFTQKINP